jgi:hypothetical protein
VSHRIAKVDQQTIAKVLGDMPIVALDNFRTRRLICPHHFPVLFGIKLGGKFRGVHEITEHDGELATFSFRYTMLG